MKRWTCDGHSVVIEQWPAGDGAGRVYTLRTTAAAGAGTRQWLMPKCALLAMPTPQAAARGDMVQGAGYSFLSRCAVRVEDTPDPVAARHAPRRPARSHRIGRHAAGGGAA